MWKFIKIRESTYHRLNQYRENLSTKLKRSHAKRTYVSFNKAIDELLKQVEGEINEETN